MPIDFLCAFSISLVYQNDSLGTARNYSVLYISKFAKFPKSPENVLGRVDCFDIPISEKPIRQNIIVNKMKTAPNLVFVNNKKNI